MIDIKYLEKFGDHRYEHFSYGRVIEDIDFFSEKDEYFFLDDLEVKNKSNNLKELEKLLYWIFTMTEEIKRIDFDSKYIFHSLTPKARNINSIKIGIVYGEHIYKYNPLNNMIYKKRNDLILAEKNKAYIIVFSWDSKTQLFYGEFHKMLSLLNLGHATLNIKYALEQTNLNYRELKQVTLNEDLYISLFNNFTYINKVIEVDISDEATLINDISDNLVNKNIVHKLIYNNNMYLNKFFNDFNKEQFILRSSSQKRVGDKSFKETITFNSFKSLLNKLILISDQTEIEFFFYIDNVEGYDRGYYKLKRGVLNNISPADSILEHELILKDYSDFTNINYPNFWFFMVVPEYRDKDTYNELFVDMGVLAQFLSICVANLSLAARPMKNYNDVHLKNKFKLSKSDLIGYSLLVFPLLSEAQSYKI